MKKPILFATILSASLISLGNVATTKADWKDDIGYTALQARIGAMLEDGSGVVVAMSEAPNGSGNYMPNVSDSQFSGKTFIDETGSNSGTNSHANTVARFFFGNTTSIAGGVTEIHSYEAGDWAINESGAATGSDPAVPAYKVINNSWVARPDVSDPITESNAAIVLTHIDHMIDQYDTLVVGATDNPGHQFPRLLAPSYNSIIVGLTNGTHTYGVTEAFYGPGRTKPDIVAPSTVTSNATPMVSSAAALLHQKAAGTDAARSETMRAILMAGATKSEFTDWDHTTTRPLDEVYGAGELNVDNSYAILEGGQFAGSSSEPTSFVAEDGWDYQATFDSTGSLYYDFEVADGMQMEDFSVILAWNLEVIDADATSGFDPSFNLADFNLRLYDSSDSFLGNMLDASLSTVDNVEHIFAEQLSAGRYTIEVTGDQDRDFAIAWSSSFSAVPEPGTGLAVAFAGMLLLAGKRTRRC